MNNRDLILEELTKLSIAYPAAKRGMAEIEVLADMWVEDLEEFCLGEISQAIRKHRKLSPFFPTSAEIREICEHIRRTNAPTYSSLPQQPKQISDSERRRNKEQVGKILQMLAKDKAMGEG